MDAEESRTPTAWRDITPDAARRLVIAAVEAFAERGYHATTTRDIAGRAGMSPAALYIHYKTKEELLYQISRVGHLLSLGLLTEARDGGGTRGRAARRGGARLRALARRAPHHRPRRAVRARRPRPGALRRDRRAAAGDRGRDPLDHHGRRGGGEFDVPDVSGTTLAVLSLCIDVARWFNPDGRRTPDEVGALYAGLVAADGGRRPAVGPGGGAQR